MTDIKAARLFRKKPVRRYVGRGATYSWLRAYHREVAAALARREQSWASLVADMSLDGVMGRSGAPLTANAALRVWPRVCRDVTAEADAKAQAATQRKGMPSRRSPDWRPEVVSQSPAVSPPPIRFPPQPAGTVLQTSVAKPALRSPAEVQAMIDKVFEDFAASDRRKLEW